MKTKHVVGRKLELENCKIQGRSYSFPVTKTRDRAGWHQTGELPTGRRIYENSFPGVRLNDDELAVADVLMHMKKYVETKSLSFVGKDCRCVFEFCDGGSAT